MADSSVALGDVKIKTPGNCRHSFSSLLSRLPSSELLSVLHLPLLPFSLVRGIALKFLALTTLWWTVGFQNF